MNMPVCMVHRLGMVEYQEAWDLQNKLVVEVAAGTRPATLLLLEHPHTYTFGRRGRIENLLWDQEELERRGVKVHWVDRGGDVTYHGPGQLVGYPLLPLSTGSLLTNPTGGSPRLPQADYVGFVRKLEQTLILALARFGVDSRQVEGLTGVWVNRTGASSTTHLNQATSHIPVLAKIAAIGVKVNARGVSMHGFALNVNPDMTYWEGIIGCGLEGLPVTCLADQLDPVPGVEIVAQAVINAFGVIYQYQMIEGANGLASTV